MPETLTFFCLVNGETASTAFPIKISSGDTIGDLKELIRTKMAVQFSDIDANQLTLWKISIPIVAEEKHKVISLDCLVSKDELLPSDELPEVFGDNPLKKTIHILVHRPPREKDLNIDTIFNIIIKDKIPQTLEWTTNPKTATLDELRDHIHASLPRLHGERRKIGFDHPKSKPFPEGGVDWLVADAKLRTILKMYIQGGLSDMNLYLEFPQKGFSSFSLDDVKTRLRVMHFGVFHVERVPCNTGERKEVLDRLYVALELARDTIGEILNEGCATRFIGPFLMAAVTLFPDLQLTPERGISGRWGTGSVDYMIESRNAPESNMLGVVEAKQGKTYDDGLPQNIIQLDATLTNREVQDSRARVKRMPLISYGIVSDASRWLFIECRIDVLDMHSLISEPTIIRKAELPVIVDYKNVPNDQWREQVKAVFEHVVWLVGKMSQGISSSKRIKEDTVDVPSQREL